MAMSDDVATGEHPRILWHLARGHTEDRFVIINNPRERRGVRIDLKPVGGTPLRSGNVVDTFTEGPQVFAIERYQLNGATPNTTYRVQLVIHLGNPNCSGPAIIQPSVDLTTNQNGNGQSSIRVPPAFIPPPALNRVNSLFWQLLVGGTVHYQTDCLPIFEDIPNP
jgi:hypothetical protein